VERCVEERCVEVWCVEVCICVRAWCVHVCMYLFSCVRACVRAHMCVCVRARARRRVLACPQVSVREIVRLYAACAIAGACTHTGRHAQTELRSKNTRINASSLARSHGDLCNGTNDEREASARASPPHTR
jgi:hypothetical protein